MLDKGNMGYLKNITDRVHTGLGNDNYSPLLWEELGPQDLKPRSPKAPAKPLSALPLPGFREVATFLSIHQGLREKNLLKALAPGYYWLDQARSWF